MIRKLQAYKLPIFISIFLHIIIFACLFIRFPKAHQKQTNNVSVIQAVAVNDNQPPVSPMQPISQKKIREIEKIALKQPSVVKKNEQLIKQLPDKPAMSQEKMQESEIQEPEIDENAQAIAKKKLALAKKQEAKRKQEIKRREEQLAQERAEEEARQLQEELASEAKQVANAKIDAEDDNKEIPDNTPGPTQDVKKELAGSIAANQSGEIDKYKQMIVQSISRKWLIPEAVNQDLTCQLLVHLAPGGIVMNVDIIKESGDPNLDRSARNAILKASPLPVPNSVELFDNFRALRLTFRPQGIVSG